MSLPPLRITLARDVHFQEIYRAPEDTGPPWQLRRQRMIYVAGHWPEGAALPDLPAGLTPAEGRTGVLGIYVAEEGRGLAPISLGFGALAVRETWAPDGTQAAFIFHGHAGGPLAGRLTHWLNDRYAPGAAEVEPGDIWQARILCAAGAFQVTSAPLEGARQVVADTNYYIGLKEGLPVGYGVAYSLNFVLGTAPQIRIDLPEDHPLALFRAFIPEYTMLIDDMSMTYGRAVPLDLAAPDRASTLGERQSASGQTAAMLDIFGRLGRAIALADDTGRVLYANDAAEAVLRRLAAHARLPGQTALAGRGGGAIRPEGLRLALPLEEGGTAFARVMPVSLRLTDRPALLVLLDDPATEGPFDPGVLLQLYGLTPAEARLAALVGRGAAPGAAARELGITIQTARSVLKTVFAKLAINRQAELARIVARLEMV